MRTRRREQYLTTQETRIPQEGTLSIKAIVTSHCAHIMYFIDYNIY